jgi:hypothetical protein
VRQSGEAYAANGRFFAPLLDLADQVVRNRPPSDQARARSANFADSLAEASSPYSSVKRV